MTCSWCQATHEGPQCAVLSGLLASFISNAFITLTLLYGVVFNPFSLMCCCHHLAATMLYSIATLLIYSPASLLLYSRSSLLIYSPASLLIYSSPCYSTSRLLATPLHASLLLHFTPPSYSTLRLLATPLHASLLPFHFTPPCYSTSCLLATPLYASLLLHFTPPCYSTLLVHLLPQPERSWCQATHEGPHGRVLYSLG